MRIWYVLLTMASFATTIIPALSFADENSPPIKLVAIETPLLHGAIRTASTTVVGRAGHPALIIDDQLRMIGGDGLAGPLNKSQAPVQKFHFLVNGEETCSSPTLVIGYVRGVNTPEAHEAGQSQASYISSPAVVKVNGVRVGYIYTDTQGVRITIPSWALRRDGFNTLQVEAGFYFLPGNYVAYDEIQFQRLSIEY